MEFFAIKKMPEAWMMMFLTLELKKPDAAKLCHYRSISLCTILYKICYKLMIERMKSILPRLICSEQGVFIHGQSITDNIMIAHELM